jgi:hypothetical protein
MRLLYLDFDGINKLVKEYENDTKAIKDELYRMCWYMRGSISISESFLLTAEDRQIISTIIEDNLKATKESGLPFF